MQAPPILIALLLLWTAIAVCAPTPIDLRCDYRTNPEGIDTPHPALGWKIDGGEERGVRQKAYRILAASSEGLLEEGKADLWDSGKVLSDESLHHPYLGSELHSRERCCWKVRIWDQQDHESPWSETGHWTMGILSGKEWHGHWIQGNTGTPTSEAAIYLRSTAVLHKPVLRATARYACLGFVDLLINGKKPDDSIMLETPYTNPDHRVNYVTHDVTGLLHEGENCISAILGNGYNSPPSNAWNGWQRSKGPPKLLLEVEVEFTDGTREYFGTDEGWKSSLGRIRYNDFWVKEIHDLGKEQAGWDQASFDASAWTNVIPAEPPKGLLVAARVMPVRRFEEMPALRREGNRYFFDKVYTGFPRIKVKGKAGDTVSVRGQDVTPMNKVFGPAVIDYTLANDREVTLEPRFFAHTVGPTLEISGVSPLPEPKDVSIVRVHGDLHPTGAFECSNPLFNQLHETGLRTHLNYVHYYPNDPTREKAGWSQDMQNMFDSASYLTDTALMYEMWWRDFADVQRADGNAPSVAPVNVGFVDIWNDPWWGGMVVYGPWRHYEYYGDKRVLENAYEPMKRYVGFLTKLAETKGGLLTWAGASDWIEVGIPTWGPPKRTPTHLVSTMAWYYYTTILARTASILGNENDAHTYRALAEKIRQTYNAKYFDPVTGIYAKAADSQASLIMPLCFGFVPNGKEGLVLQRLVENIHRRGDHLSTGFVSTAYLLHGLTDLGQAELAGKIVNQKDHPGFISNSNHGVFMETWTGGMAQMPSLGGPCVGWLYRAVLGIRADPREPGFRRIIIKPEMMPEVTWARGYYDSVRGRIVSDWKLKDGTFNLRVVIPGNTTATVWVPADSADQVLEGKKPASSSHGIKFLGMEKGCALYEVGSGTYEFQSRVSDNSAGVTR